MRLAPKNCIVSSITLLPGGRAEIRFRCVRDGMIETGQYQYPIKGGGFSNYPSKIVKARSVSFRGATMTGTGSRMDFVLSPASAVCHKDGRAIRCKLEGDKSLPSLEGLQRKRKRKRK